VLRIKLHAKTTATSKVTPTMPSDIEQAKPGLLVLDFNTRISSGTLDRLGSNGPCGQ
jgi:hypothetical protein